MISIWAVVCAVGHDMFFIKSLQRMENPFHLQVISLVSNTCLISRPNVSEAINLWISLYLFLLV